MKALPARYSCLNCQDPIDPEVDKYSIKHYNFPLCIPCQRSLCDKIKATTRLTLDLYFQLRKKGIAAELEKSDGFKHIDIAVVEARLNIEVDGLHHNAKHDQALTDLQRTYYSFKKGFYTLRIPNSLVKYHLFETADHVANFVEVSLSKRNSR